MIGWKDNLDQDCTKVSGVGGIWGESPPIRIDLPTSKLATPSDSVDQYGRCWLMHGLWRSESECFGLQLKIQCVIISHCVVQLPSRGEG